jgi:acyl carrier protein
VNAQKRLEWLTNVLSVNGRVLTPDDTRHTVSEWDSMGDLMVLASLEEDLKIVVSADELAAIGSVGELFALLERKYALPTG